MAKMNGFARMSFIVLAMVFVFAPLVHAGLEIKSYTVTPSPLRPGMSGSINIEFNNPSATESIKDAFLTATANNFIFISGVNVGDLGGQGSSIVSVPFKIRDDARAGQVIVSFGVGYTSSTGGSGLSKSFSVPVSISSPQSLTVRSVTADKATITPGDAFKLRFTLENKGGDLKNFMLDLPSGSPFTLDGVSAIEVGSFPEGAVKEIEMPLVAGTSVTAGYYAIVVNANYDDAVAAGNVVSLALGPLGFGSASSKVSFYAETEGTSPGSTGKIRIVVKNIGSTPLSNVKIKLPGESAIFVPVDFNEKSIASLLPGEQKLVEFNVGINTNILPQVYPATFTVTFESRSGSETVEGKVGIKVDSNPEVLLILETDPAPVTTTGGKYTVSVQVSNNGDTALRAVGAYVTSDAFDFIGAQENYIGTLNLDDYGTAQFTAVVKPLVRPGTYDFTTRLTYKDSYNQPHNLTKVTKLQVVSPEVAALSQGTQGGSPLLFVAALVIAALIGYFVVYKRFIQKKKPSAD